MASSKLGLSVIGALVALAAGGFWINENRKKSELDAERAVEANADAKVKRVDRYIVKLTEGGMRGSERYLRHSPTENELIEALGAPDKRAIAGQSEMFAYDYPWLPRWNSSTSSLPSTAKFTFRPNREKRLVLSDVDLPGESFDHLTWRTTIRGHY
jgi:hypothetical protein